MGSGAWASYKPGHERLMLIRDVQAESLFYARFLVSVLIDVSVLKKMILVENEAFLESALFVRLHQVCTCSRTASCR